MNTQQQILVLRADTLSLPVQVNLAAANPAIFTTNGSQGMIVDAKCNVVASGNAAKAGGPITVYCTGLGELSSQFLPEALDPLHPPQPRRSLSIEGQAATIQFGGLAPQLVGIYFVRRSTRCGNRG